MFFNSDRNELRTVFFDVFKKYQEKKMLDPLESNILTVILQHPEYHDLLDQKEKYLEKDYLPEFGDTNPFLHLSLHLAIREQVNTNRPEGIQNVYQELLNKIGDPLTVEHHMMECLVETLWIAQKNNQQPDDATYLLTLRSLRFLRQR